MQTALENLIEYVENTFNDDELNNYIENVNFVAGNIYKLNKAINDIEEDLIFGDLKLEVAVKLDNLKELLTKEIDKL